MEQSLVLLKSSLVQAQFRNQFGLIHRSKCRLKHFARDDHRFLEEKNKKKKELKYKNKLQEEIKKKEKKYEIAQISHGKMKSEILFAKRDFVHKL